MLGRTQQIGTNDGCSKTHKQINHREYGIIMYFEAAISSASIKSFKFIGILQAF